MKKWILIGGSGIAIVVAMLSFLAFMEVRANDGALEDIRDSKSVVVLNVAGMT